MINGRFWPNDLSQNKKKCNKSYNYAEINFYVFTVTYGTNSPAASKKQDTSQ